MSSVDITSASFGTLAVTMVDAEASLTVDVGTVIATLSMDLGTPGPAGPTGATGATGPAGSPGVGVPTGGSTGQILAKASGTSYDTEWVNALTSVNWGQIGGTLSSQTDLNTALGLKYDASNPSGFITSSALSGYLLSSTAASTYYPLTNPSGYITSSALSGYLTSATAASTYQTLSGMSSYLTTASAASTYFTISNAASKADLASPTFTGTPASVSPAYSDRSTKIATMESVKKMIFHPGAKLYLDIYALQTVVSGAGAAVGYYPPYTLRVAGCSSGTAGSALFRTNNSSNNSNNNAGLSIGNSNGQINWSNPVWFSFRYFMDTVNTTEVFRASIGKPTGAAVGALTGRGISVTVTGQGFLVLSVHNGTTLTSVTSSFQTVAYNNVDIEVYSDGSGNAYLYANGNQVASTSGAPTTLVSSGGMIQFESVSSGAQTTQQIQFVHTIKAFFG